MTKYLFILIALISFQKSQCQIVFCPPGAEWHSLGYSMKATGDDYANVTIKYMRDSVIGTESVKVLRHNDFFTRCNFVSGNRLSVLRQKGDTVFIRNVTTQHTWQILYNYAATAGQSWTMSICAINNPAISKTYTVNVDSVNNKTVNSFVLKNLFVKCKMTSAISYTAQITERFGCIDNFTFYYLNPDFTSCSGATDGISKFLCYQDGAFGLKQFTEYACDYVNPVGIKENNYQNSNIKISPNPANDFFTIDSENEILKGESIVSINDLTGRAVKQINLKSLNSEKINVTGLANGVYILNITNSNSLVYTAKLVKTD